MEFTNLEFINFRFLEVATMHTCVKGLQQHS